MFDVLLESRPPRDRTALSKGSMASLTTHAILVALVAATASGGALYLSGPIERAIFLAPFRGEPSTAAEEKLAFVRGGDGRGRFEGIDGLPDADALLQRGGRGAGLTDAGSGDAIRSLNDLPAPLDDIAPAFNVFDVDGVAERAPDAVAPPYPGSLLRLGIEGSTDVQFVVDSTGMIDMRTFRVVSATHPLFTLSVYSALPQMRYRPATIAGRPVRQLVQQEFRFRIVPASKPAMQDARPFNGPPTPLLASRLLHLGN